MYGYFSLLEGISISFMKMEDRQIGTKSIAKPRWQLDAIPGNLKKRMRTHLMRIRVHILN